MTCFINRTVRVLMRTLRLLLAAGLEAVKGRADFEPATCRLEVAMLYPNLSNGPTRACA